MHNGAFRFSGDEHSQIQNCTFDRCSSGGPVGVMAFLSTAVNTLSNCLFDRCASNSSYTAAVEVFSVVHITNCHFFHCSSRLRWIISMYSYSEQSLSNVTFVGCEVTNLLDGEVVDLVMNGNGNLVDCFSTSHQPHIYSGNLLGLPFPNWKVTSSGVDEEVCGLWEKKCQSVEYVVSQCIAENEARTATEMQTMTLLDEIHTISPISIGNKSITICGEKEGDMPKTSLCGQAAEATDLFTVSTGRLALIDLTLIPLAGASFVSSANGLTVKGCEVDGSSLGSSTLSSPFVSITSGSLVISASSFSSIDLSSDPLFSLSTSFLSVSLDESAFNAIHTSSSLGGSVLSVSVGIAQTVSITSCAFVSCSSSVGEGGAVRVVVSEGSFRIDSACSFRRCTAKTNGGGLSVDLAGRIGTGSFEIGAASFGLGEEMNEAEGKGNDMFIATVAAERSLINLSSVQLASLLTPANDSHFFSATELAACWFEEVGGVEGSLLYLWHPYSGGTVGVLAQSPVDSSFCGNVKLPCSSLSVGNALVRESSAGADDIVVLFLSDIPLSSTLSTSKEVKWEGHGSDRMTLQITGDENVIVDGGKLTLVNLIFTVSFSSFSKSFFEVNGGSLSVDSCDFVSIRSTHSGPAIHATLGADKTLSLSSVSFKQCHSSDGDGGAVFLDLTSTTSHSHYSFTSVTFGCGDERNTAEGRGHDVFVWGSTLSSLIVSSQWTNSHPSTFGEDNEGCLWGEDRSEAGTPFESTTLLVYLLDLEGPSTEVRSNGKDVRGCGRSTTPCQTLQTSLSHLSESETNVVIVQDETEINFELLSDRTDLTMMGQDTPKSVKVKDNGKVTITRNILRFHSLAFTTTLSSFSRSLMTLSSAGSLSIVSCSFASFHSTNPGSIVSGSLHFTSFVSVQSCSFDSCSSDEDGGVFSLSCEEDIPSSSLTINATFLPSCSCGHSKKGSFVFLEGWGFEELLEGSNWEQSCASLSTPANDNTLFGIDHSESAESAFHEVSLLFYLLPFRGLTIHAGSEGRNSNGCGTESKICRSLELAHSHLEGKGKYSLIVENETVLSSPLLFAQNDMVIEPDSGRGTIRIVGLGSFVDSKFDSTHVLTISRIIFELSAATCEVLFHSGQGQLILQSCSFSSSSSMSCELVRVEQGEFTLDNTTFSDPLFDSTPFTLSSLVHAAFHQVTLTSSSLARFLSASGQTKDSLLSIDTCRFEGKPTSELNTKNDTDDEDVCSWSSGLLEVSDCQAVLTSVTFFSLPQGTVWILGGSLSLATCSFEGCSQHNERFPSVRRNVRCSGGGSVVVQSLSGGDGFVSSHCWISSDECSVKNGTDALLSPLFVASLDSKASKSTRNKNKTLSIEIAGSTFVPCGLKMEVFQEGSSDTVETAKIDLSPPATVSFSETRIELEVSEESLTSTLNKKMEWKGRLVFGDGERSPNSFVVRPSQAAMNKASAGRAMKWAIPTIVGVVAVLLFVLILIVCLRRRKQKAAKKPTLVSQEELDENIEKMDVNMDMFQAGSEDRTELQHDIKTESAENPPSTLHAPSSGSRNDGYEWVRVVGVNANGAVLEERAVLAKDTLYNRLHPPSQKRELDKRAVMRQIVEAVKETLRFERLSQQLLLLSSHRVMFDENEKVCLKLGESLPLPSAVIAPLQNEPQLQPDSLSLSDTKTILPNDPNCSFFPQPQQQSQPSLNSNETGQPKNENAAFEEIRWQAPEVQSKKTNVNVSQASVFSLGLVLWEIDTGQVPFREFDAMNAGRQGVLGVQPNLGLVEDKDLAEMIGRCVQMEPVDRASLAELSSFFSTKEGVAKEGGKDLHLGTGNRGLG
ncbi:hypothetical protein BLNAU_5799 [Blattamonas nauphoetae]|uniref:Serine-threonine/tyrosine-protein kinase catalytic domain-containing protein n=1 Tax=Blattamonas nauphoetae TaxID=2049346 RepID=A0ABQ9Y694_9EUKA|nr:hypothetical protein BLNAU_5799 [Blattamonas nauphoetae]